jgi:5'-deoxynucleotidase YfbR-like HD superfamily hydrolase
MSSMIQTFTGRVIDPLDPDPYMFNIRDIAHSLSNQCRFTGHVKEFYSVAEHSVRCASFVLEELDGGKDLAFIALMHDASEAYLSDIARPVKQAAHFGDAYRDIEDGLQRALSYAFEFQYPFPDIIHKVDNALLLREQIDLMPFGMQIDSLLEYPHEITPWTPKIANALFLSTYTYLTGERPGR